jgi:hypothetical protein
MNTLRRARSDRGSSTTELVIAMPVLLMLIMLIVQFGSGITPPIAEAAAQKAFARRRDRLRSSQPGVATVRGERRADRRCRRPGTPQTPHGSSHGVRSIVPGMSLPVVPQPSRRWKCSADINELRRSVRARVGVVGWRSSHPCCSC